ncbi:redoxin domain-containing protein [Spirosoma lituiforme]
MRQDRGSGKWVYLLVCNWLAVVTYGQLPHPINTIPLRTLTQQRVTLGNYSRPLLAVVFLSPECPLCQQYTRTLNQLQRQYATELTIVGVFPGKAYSSAECQQFKSTYQLDFTLLMDRSRRLSSALGATTTPEVFLFDQQRSILYAGAIDDWVVSLGRTRNKADKTYLADAIAATKSGYPVSVARTTAIGCLINDY